MSEPGQNDAATPSATTSNSGAAPAGAPSPLVEPAKPAERLKPYRWQKGQSGNPGGRPKGKGLTAALRALGETEHNGKTLVELLADRLFKEALVGKFPFAKEVIERLEGKVPDKHQVESTGEQKIYVCPAPRIIGDADKIQKLKAPAGDTPEDPDGDT